MKILISVSCVLALTFATLVLAQDKPESDELQVQARELAQKRRELLEQQIEILQRQLETTRQQTPGSKAVLAMEAILHLKLSQERVMSSLSGAKVVAADGTYLGRIGPTYDTESIFCSYGTYGADYSTKSIWCTYGKYGASYNDLSPFCSYSSKPPKIVLDGTVVASLTVGWAGSPVSISPHALKAIFAE